MINTRIKELEKLIEQLKQEQVSITQLERISFENLLENIADKRRLSELWIELKSKKMTDLERGKKFEEFTIELFKGAFTIVRKNRLTDVGKFDIIVENNNKENYWSKFGANFFIECKNWEKNAPTKETGFFTNKTGFISHLRLVFFISMSNFTKSSIHSLKYNAVIEKTPLIGPIAGTDIEKYLESNQNFKDFLKDMITRIMFLEKNSFNIS